MDDDYIACPQDPELRYLRSFCAACYRNSDHHHWCRQCPHFSTSGPGELSEADKLGSAADCRNDPYPGERTDGRK